MKPAIYTFGYQGRRPGELFAEVERLDAVVIDVRLVPRSRARGWSQGDLAALLGDRYVHVGALGNLNYKNGGPVRLADPEAGLAQVLPLLAAGRAVILLCYEARPQDCHRAVVAQRLAGRAGCLVRHLLGTDLVHEGGELREWEARVDE